jgi:hypothetical protein
MIDLALYVPFNSLIAIIGTIGSHIYLVLIVPVATFLYVVLDIYPVIKSFQALIRTFSFWLLWLLFSILNAVSFALFQAGSLKVLGAAGVNATVVPLLTVFFSTVGVFSIVQSFSLKFAGYKAVDLEQMFEKLRATVLTEAAGEKAELTKDRQLDLARRLTAFYNANPELIDRDYERLMSFGGRSPEKIIAEIDSAGANPRGKIVTLANRMALADERGAEQIYFQTKFMDGPATADRGDGEVR